jgi:hypothetical protein
MRNATRKGLPIARKSERTNEPDPYKNKIVVGIDPDTNASGVAVYDTGAKDLRLLNLTFFQLMGFLDCLKLTHPPLAKVFIEAGWLNRSHWSARAGQNLRDALKIAANTGANHEVGRKIVELCEHLQIPFELVRPEREKLDAQLFKRIYKYEKPTNQEQRDVVAVIAGFIKI